MVEIEIFSCKLGFLIWGIFVWFLWRLWKRGEDEEIQEKLDQWMRDNIHKDR